MKNRYISKIVNFKKDNTLKLLLEYSSDIVICLTTDFTIFEFNKSAETFYNWSYKEVYGKNFLKLCKMYALACPINSKFFNKPSSLNINLDTKNFSGKPCNINWIVLPIKSNKVEGAMLIGKNVELRKNNVAYYLNELINCIPGCVYWKDREGHYLGCNELTAKLAGLNYSSEIIGKTDAEVWGKQSDLLVQNDKEVLATGKTIIVEEALQAADGRWLYFTGLKMPLRDENDKIIGIIGNSLDITELKTTQAELKKSIEKAEALSKAKTDFIANMSHDVKTPLSGIIGLSETLLQNLKGKERDLMQSVFVSGQQLLNFFDNCIDMAKSEEAKILLTKEHFSLKILFEQIMQLLQPAAKNKNLRFSLNYDKKIPKLLIGNREGIYRIVLNLVGNAIKFTEKGEVSIYVKLIAKTSQKKVTIKFLVEDTGIGIPKDKQKNIFEYFVRLTPSYKGIYEGSGIGLYVVNKFVQSMQGQIYVESEEGKGSRFEVAIPLEIPNDKDIEDSQYILPKINELKIKSFKEQKISKLSHPKHSKKNNVILSRVLLVEDNIVAQKIAQMMLAAFSKQIDMAGSGAEALELFKPGKYDLVIMDIGLPDNSGCEITERLRKIEKSTAYHVPIVGLTAHADDAVKKQCLKLGMDDVFNKPLSEKLIQLIHNQYVSSKHIKISKLKNDISAKSKSISLSAIIGKNYSKELLGMLIESLPEFCKDMELAYNKKDINTLVKLIHKFHGGVCYTDTPQLLQTASLMETALKKNELSKLDVLYKNLKNAINAFKKAYKLL